MADDVKELHPEFLAKQDQWKMVRDAIAGEEAVKKETTRYLPKPEAMEEPDYTVYITRAEFYGATKFTALGLIGRVFRKPTRTTVPPAIEEMLKNVTLGGADFDQFARSVLGEQISVGRYGVLLEWANSAARPVLLGYRAENIRNWKVEVINGEPKLTQVVLEEQEPLPGRFTRETQTVYRVLELIDGVYQVSLWRPAPPSAAIVTQPASTTTAENKPKTTEGPSYVEAKLPTPLMRGVPLAYIPFVFFGVEDNEAKPASPPLYDLACVNYSHYRSSADLETARFKCAQPTPVATGVPKELIDKVGALHIGSNAAWLLPTGAQAMMLEPSGNGLTSLEAALTTKESRMRSLGARALQEPKKDAETEQAKRIEQSSESSVLKGIVDTASSGFTTLLKWFTDWALEEPKDVVCQINKDFFESSLSPQQISALVAAWQAGAFPQSVLFKLFREGEIISEDMTDEDLLREIEEEMMRRTGLGGAGEEPGDTGAGEGGKPGEEPGAEPEVKPGSEGGEDRAVAA